MLIDLSQAVGNYLHDVFVAKFQWWVLLGYIAQIMFTMRFVVQWVASERAGKMVMPIAFGSSRSAAACCCSLMRFTSATRFSSWGRASEFSCMRAIFILNCVIATAQQLDLKNHNPR